MVRRGGARVYGDTIPGHQRDKRILVLKPADRRRGRHHAVEFPNAMITRKGRPTLASGCAMVLKPASQTPFSAIALAVLAERAGLPAGLFQRCHRLGRRDRRRNDREPGGAQAPSPARPKSASSFTAKAPRPSRNWGLELGGNAPFIVFDDADLDAAVEGALIAKYRNNGQTCVCAPTASMCSRRLRRLPKKLIAAVAKLKTGDGFAEGVNLGPLIDKAALERCRSTSPTRWPKARRSRWAASRTRWRHLLRGDRADRRDARHGGGARGNLARSRRFPLFGRGRGDRAGQ